MRGTLGRLDRTRLHAKATSDTRWFSCRRSPTRPVRRAVGPAFDEPAADPGIRARGSIPRVNCARGNGSCAPSDEGLILDSKNMILPDDPPSALLVCRMYPSWDVLSVMYITDSMGRGHFYYVYVLGRSKATRVLTN